MQSEIERFWNKKWWNQRWFSPSLKGILHLIFGTIEIEHPGQWAVSVTQARASDGLQPLPGQEPRFPMQIWFQTSVTLQRVIPRRWFQETELAVPWTAVINRIDANSSCRIDQWVQNPMRQASRLPCQLVRDVRTPRATAAYHLLLRLGVERHVRCHFTQILGTQFGSGWNSQKISSGMFEYSLNSKNDSSWP